MKKILFAILSIAMLAFAGCSKDSGKESGDGDSPLKKITWEQLVKEHPFMGGFPKFDGEIEGYVYKETMGLESVVFFDYKCDKSVSTTYYGKLVKSGFTDKGNEIYEKTADGKEYTFIGGYAAGNFALSFNCE